jgi:7-cyano-7-deazaguanine synthase
VSAPGPSAVVLLSGGLDSGVALALWQERGGAVALCLSADYGQRAAVREAEASRRLAARFGAPWRSVELPWLGDAARLGGAAIVRGADRLPPERTSAAPGDADSAAAVWVPARNVVLVAAAAAFAEAMGAGVIVAGFNREEAATFPDNSAAFVDAVSGALRLGTRSGVRVESPVLDLDKRAIVAEARRAGLSQGDFWSCYLADSDPASCACESCVRSRNAWGMAAEG